MATHFYWLAIGVLAAWRIAHLLYGEDGPWNVFVTLRRALSQGFWNSLLDCFYCLSLWVSLPMALCLGESWKERLLLWPAISAGATLLERLTAKEEFQLPIQLTQAEEDHFVVNEQSGVENSRRG